MTAEVTVSGGQAEQVELLAGEQVIASASAPPYTFTWDTTTSAEGPYVLWARATAKGKTFASPPRLAVVDRTPPAVLSQTPAGGELFDGSRASMSLTFTEPLLPSSVVTSRFSVGSATAASAELSADGRTLTFLGAESLSRPDRLHVFAFDSGLTDLAGNPLGTVRSQEARLVSAWKARYPFVQAYEGQTETAGPVLAFAGSTAYAAWVEQEPGVGFNRGVHVRSWNGTSWQALGGRINPLDIGVHAAPSLVIDSSGAPIVAFRQWEASGNDAKAWVYRWQGGQWVNLGGGIHALAGDTYVEEVSLAVVGTAPVVAWTEFNGQRSDVFVRRWDGTSWQALGGAVNTSTEGVLSSFAAHTLSLIRDAQGTLFLAWAATTADHEAILVARYTGAAWQRLGSPLHVTVGGAPRQPSLAVDASGNPYVAWVESDSRIFAARYGNEGWEPLGERVNDPQRMHVSHPSILLRAGTPYVAWTERLDNPNAKHVQIRGFDTFDQRWKSWAKPLSAYPNTTNSTHAEAPWLTTDADGSFIVAFAEEDESGQGGIHFYRPE